MQKDSVYARFARHMPEVGGEGAINFGQGFTPVVRSRTIGPRAGLANLYFKLESLNPSGSYKDRFAGLAIGFAKAKGAKRTIATSSGNTGAALAAASAAAGLQCSLYVSENAPAGKLEQMLAYGASVYRVRQFTIDAAESALISETLTRSAVKRGIELFITAHVVSPVPMAGIKTIAYELADAIETIADVFVPVGGGGLHVAIARGFADLERENAILRTPRVHVVQPSGNDTIATPLRLGSARAAPVLTATRISGLGVGYILDGNLAIEAARHTGGRGYRIDEDRILDVQRSLAHEEGILAEPAGATSVAGALDAVARGELLGSDPVVCIVTGHGFKDPESVRRMGDPLGARLIGREGIEETLDHDEG